MEDGHTLHPISITVALCVTARHAVPLSRAAELARAGVPTLLVLAPRPGPPPSPPPGVAVLATEVQGPEALHNAALTACPSDVLAILDGDVEPGPGWARALLGAWARAGEDVACISGPLRLELGPERPSWLSDRLTWDLPGLDRGPQPLALNLSRDTSYAGNLSVRTDAARGVGGFPPFRGHHGLLDRNSAAHRLQRELGRQGWSGRHEPALRSEGVV